MTSSLRRGLIVVFAALVVDALVALIAFETGADLRDLTRDPAAVAGVPPLTGMLSMLGALVWTFAIAACVLGYRLHQLFENRAWQRFFFYSAVLTTVLMFDDLFQIHEDLAPTYLGFPERGVHAAYLAAMFAWLLRFRGEILRTDVSLLCAAFFFFGLSMSIDVADGHLGHVLGEYRTQKTFIEDALKFVGICSWCGYFGTNSFATLKALLRREQPIETTVASLVRPEAPAHMLPQ